MLTAALPAVTCLSARAVTCASHSSPCRAPREHSKPHCSKAEQPHFNLPAFLNSQNPLQMPREGLQAKAWKYRRVRKRDGPESPKPAPPASSPRHRPLLEFRDETPGPCHPLSSVPTPGTASTPAEMPAQQGMAPGTEQHGSNPHSQVEWLDNAWEREIQERTSSKKGPGSPSWGRPEGQT